MSSEQSPRPGKTGTGDEPYRSMRNLFIEYLASTHRVVHAFSMFLDHALEGDLTQAEAIVLLHVANTGSATMHEVHQAFMHRRSTLTNVVDRLETRGLVQRRIGDRDRRNFLLVPTPSGQRLAARVQSVVHRLERLAKVSPRSLCTARAALEKTISAIMSEMDDT